MDALTTFDDLVLGCIYLAVSFVLLVLGTWIYDRVNPHYSLRHELAERDNMAVGIALAGYLTGLVIALTGVLVGESIGLWWDLVDLVVYGLSAIVLLIVASFVNDKVILNTFDNEDELIRDQNAGMGAISAGTHIATGLVIYGAISGFGGGFITLLVFFALGQLVLVLVSRLYEAVVPFDLHDEIEKDNVAVGVTFAGVLVALGNIVRIASEGDFISWTVNLTNFGILVGFGLLILPLLRLLADRVMVPGRKISDELSTQAVPNIGAGFVAAASYFIVSMLIGVVV